MKLKTVNDYPRIDIYIWYLNTPLDFFIKSTGIEHKWGKILKNPKNIHLNKCKNIMDLIELDSSLCLGSEKVGGLAYSELMRALYDFGIKDCFWYPIGNTECLRLSWQKELIIECRKNISNQ